MNLEPVELLSKAKMAENERIAVRVQLESEAKRSVDREQPQPRQPRRFHFPWMHGQRHVSAT